MLLWLVSSSSFFFFNDTATTEIYTLSLHDALPIFCRLRPRVLVVHWTRSGQALQSWAGNCTLPPGVNGIVTLLGQVTRCWSKSRVNAGLAKRGPLRTGNALQKIARSASRSRTRLLARY